MNLGVEFAKSARDAFEESSAMLEELAASLSQQALEIQTPEDAVARERAALEKLRNAVGRHA